ncbi:MAG: response regulator transcription factor [Methylotenera sp.]|uniref:response regulator transcription factor n=1 Tax=Methylotenera sp. TaxID=2051956 RepID=UPI0027171F7E|nr:response regulator transcription factor [Methylotenera sp.]MDO9150076.1 response regulator transcription factor [Methylotenera sp.]
MRLLLVEDDAILGPQLQTSLQRAGYATDLATDGIEAEIQGKLEPYDLVILDLGLPKRNGLEILANWRKAQITAPIIILTARGGWQDKVAGFNTGADDYVSKPFQIEELLARISAVLKRSTGNAVETLHAGHFTLNEQTQTVIFDNGEQCKLTNIEFRLLRYFMLHSGYILSKTVLTEHVYEYDEDKDSNVIEVYVNRLRQKIGSHLIQTRRGQGYVFGATT